MVNAIHDFRGMALAGVGNRLRLYDLGKKQLLAKCENRVSLSSKTNLLILKKRGQFNELRILNKTNN